MRRRQRKRSHGASIRGASLTALAMGLLVALSIGQPVSSASAAGDSATETVSVCLGSGVGGGTELTVPLFLEPSIVPGDEEHRFVVVTNDAKEAGTLVAQLVNLTLAGDPADRYYSDLLVVGHPVVELVGQKTQIARVPLAPGNSTTLDVGYLFPEGATSGNHPQSETVKVSFDVLLTLSGDLPEKPPVTAPPLPPEGQIASTGFDGTSPGLATAALLTALGAGALLVTRRSSARRRSDRRLDR